MLSAQLPRDLSEDLSTFEQIYQAAKAKDGNAIRAILSQPGCIDIYDGRRYATPAALLAAEGDFEAAKFLMQFGADVNWVGHGAAVGGHFDFAEEMRTIYKAHVNWIAAGAAQGGMRDYAKTLHVDYKADISWIAKGAVVGKRRDYVNELLHDNNDVVIRLIISGAGECGDRDYAEEFCKGKNWKPLSQEAFARGVFASRIACGAAEVGNRKYAEELCKKHHLDVTRIAQSAALGGDRDYAEELRIHHGASVDEIAAGAIEGGHIKYAGE